MDFTLSTLAFSQFPQAATGLPAAQSTVLSAVTLFALARGAEELRKRRQLRLQPAVARRQ